MKDSGPFWSAILLHQILIPLANEFESDVPYFVNVQRSWILVVALCLERSPRWGRKLRSLLSSVHMPRGYGCVTISSSLLSDLFVSLVSCTVPVCFFEFCFCWCPDGVQLKLHLLCMPFHAFRSIFVEFGSFSFLCFFSLFPAWVLSAQSRSSLFCV